MSDRLAELHRQRALVQTHLKWLDQEIAAAQQLSGRPASPAPAIPDEKTPSADAGDVLISRYGSNPQDSVQSVRKGCFLAFGIALGLFCAVVLGYAYYRITHPVAAQPPSKEGPAHLPGGETR